MNDKTKREVMVEDAGDGMSFEELQAALLSGELDLPFEIDEETGEVLINVDPSDEDAMRQLQALLSDVDIELPDPEDLIDVHDGFRGGIALDMGEENGDESEAPEFDIMTLMTSNLTDEQMLDYVTNLVCGGIYDMISGAGPMALHELDMPLRQDWDIDWDDVIQTKDFEGTVRYMLGQFPADRLRPVAEAAFRRAVLVLLSEGNEFLNLMMGQMAAQIVVSADTENDEGNPLLMP